MNIKSKVLPVVVAVVVLSFACYAGYQAGYVHGERNGYDDGQAEAWSYYPQMSVGSLSVNTTQGDATFRDLLFVGESRILEMLSEEISELIMLHNQPLCHNPESPNEFIPCSEINERE